MKAETVIDAKECVNNCTVDVKLKGAKVMAWRVSMGFKLIWLAAKIIGVRSCNIEFKTENKG